MARDRALGLMALVRFDADGPVPPLSEDEYLECVTCKAQIDWVHNMWQEDKQRARCLACAKKAHWRPGSGFKGFVRRRISQTPRKREVSARWGGLVGRSFTALPDTLLVYSTRLGLDSIDVHLIALLERHRREADAPAWPRHRSLALWSGLGLRTVRGRLGLLEERGLIFVKDRRRPDGGQSSNLVWLTGLIRVLHRIERNRLEGAPIDDGLDDLLSRLASDGKKRRADRMASRPAADEAPA